MLERAVLNNTYDNNEKSNPGNCIFSDDGFEPISLNAEDNEAMAL